MGFSKPGVNESIAIQKTAPNMDDAFPSPCDFFVSQIFFAEFQKDDHIDRSPFLLDLLSYHAPLRIHM